MKELVTELVNAPSCCAELKALAQQWLADEGTKREAETTAKLIAELKEDVLPVDEVIAFFNSPQAAEIFGEEQQKIYQKHMAELKAAGGQYCDCPACAAGLKILEKFGAL
ncbi:MAG: heat-shock protein Hsp90 [Synergistaceae bacterium]|nr:heat-shock protein Hsp90 [Synergistaceae bacterium]